LEIATPGLVYQLTVCSDDAAMIEMLLLQCGIEACHYSKLAADIDVSYNTKGLTVVQLDNGT